MSITSTARKAPSDAVIISGVASLSVAAKKNMYKWYLYE
jgi:hypothetical protein